jgi:hypothetical protein
MTPPNSEPTIAPVKAPDSSIPSMPMLTTATRSDSTPARPPSAIGTARSTVASSMPVSENALPSAAHTRKAVTTRNRPMPRNQLDQRAPPRRNWRTPKNASSAATTYA